MQGAMRGPMSASPVPSPHLLEIELVLFTDSPPLLDEVLNSLLVLLFPGGLLHLQQSASEVLRKELPDLIGGGRRVAFLNLDNTGLSAGQPLLRGLNILQLLFVGEVGAQGQQAMLDFFTELPVLSAGGSHQSHSPRVGQILGIQNFPRHLLRHMMSSILVGVSMYTLLASVDPGLDTKAASRSIPAACQSFSSNGTGVRGYC